MKKICITTFCLWLSYGSIMQSIGLKKTLEDMGCESYILFDEPLSGPKNMTSTGSKKNIKTLIKSIYHSIIFKKTCERYIKSNAFIKKHTDMLYYNDLQVLKENLPEADAYIAGSDQIWNPLLCKPSFFLEYLKPGMKKLSYAASMGVYDIPTDKEAEFSRFIKGFDSYSVREEDAAEVIKKYTDKPISVNIDPTFLVKAEEWRNLTEEYPIKKPYILVYAIYWDKKLNKDLKKLHKKTGHDIVNLATGFSTVYSNKKILDASPGQFLWLIDNAEAVITSSFHGLAFSLIFNKKFSAVTNPSAPSRLNNILNKLDVVNSSIPDVLEFDTEQYANIDRIINTEKKKSIEYLKEILDIDE